MPFTISFKRSFARLTVASVACAAALACSDDSDVGSNNQPDAAASSETSAAAGSSSVGASSSDTAVAESSGASDTSAPSGSTGADSSTVAPHDAGPESTSEANDAQAPDAARDASDSTIPGPDAGSADAASPEDASASGFSEVQAVFEYAGCGRKRPGSGFATCHSTDNAVSVIDLLGPTAFDSLVGVESSTYPGHVFVVPGNPDESFLMQKLLGQLGDAGALGEPMPQGEGIQWSPLPDAELATVRDWIAAGAPR